MSRSLYRSLFVQHGVLKEEGAASSSIRNMMRQQAGDPNGGRRSMKDAINPSATGWLKIRRCLAVGGDLLSGQSNYADLGRAINHVT